MEALLGLLLLAGILAALLGAPAWIAVSIWVLLLAVLGLGVVEYIRHSVPLFRRVRFADAETNKRFRLILPEFRGRRRRYTPTRRPGTFRAWVAERGLQLTIIALLPAALAVAVAGLKIDHKWLSVAMFFGGLVLALALLLRLQTTSERARRHRRRVRTPDAADVLGEDRRPPVLLLRAFRADGLEADAAKPSDLPITFEEFIVQPLERYGPVVAIGRPGDELPPLGAYREYVAEDWQGRVRELMDAARMIAVFLDDTPGLQWELEQVRDLGLQQRLLMIVQSDERLDPGALDWGKAQQPPASGGIAMPPKGKILAVVFDTDGEPLSIIGPRRNAEYYRDAVRLGAKFIRNSAPRT